MFCKVRCCSPGKTADRLVVAVDTPSHINISCLKLSVRKHQDANQVASWRTAEVFGSIVDASKQWNRGADGASGIDCDTRTATGPLSARASSLVVEGVSSALIVSGGAATCTMVGCPIAVLTPIVHVNSARLCTPLMTYDFTMIWVIAIRPDSFTVCRLSLSTWGVSGGLSFV